MQTVCHTLLLWVVPLVDQLCPEQLVVVVAEACNLEGVFFAGCSDFADATSAIVDIIAEAIVFVVCCWFCFIDINAVGLVSCCFHRDIITTNNHIKQLFKFGGSVDGR